MRRAVVCALAAALGCRGGEEKKAPPPARDAAPQEDAVPASAPVALAPEPLPPETSEAILLERAHSAWSAVLERGSLLSRRGERGAAYGRVAAIAGGTWLLDDTAPARGLGIRIAGAGGARLEVRPGQRVLAFGAWDADGTRWVWKVTRLVGLKGEAHRVTPRDLVSRSGGDLSGGEPGEAPAGEVEPLPGKLLARGAAPEGARVFWVLAAPVRGGDGWSIADAKAGPKVATLLLPGEVLGAPYGGLDYLSPDERWALAPGKAYAAPVTEVQLRRKLPLPVLRASAPPVALAE